MAFTASLQVWLALSARARVEMADAAADDGDGYAALVAQIPGLDAVDKDQRSEELQTIDQDLPRTFPGHSFVDQPEVIEELRNILIGYTLRNRAVGYCQSMNFIAAMLLIVFRRHAAREEHAFWFLALLEERLIRKYHTPGMVGCQADTRTLLSLAKLYLPHIHGHLERFHVMPEVAFVSWFLCVFFNVLPTETALRVRPAVGRDIKIPGRWRDKDTRAPYFYSAAGPAPTGLGLLDRRARRAAAWLDCRCNLRAGDYASAASGCDDYGSSA